MNIATLTSKDFSARFFALLIVVSLVMSALPVAFFSAYATTEIESASGDVDITEVFVPVTVQSNPTLDSVSPDRGSIELTTGQNFILEVDAADVDGDLKSLEVDHSLGKFSGTPDAEQLPEFTVYAAADNVFGSPEAESAFGAEGVSVEFDAATDKWTIDFGPVITDKFVANEGITFYLVLKDEAGNKLGTMSPTSADNTFAYTMSRAAVVEEEPRSSGGGGSSSGTRIRDRVEPTPLVLGVVDSSLPTDEELTGVLTSVSGILVAIQSGNEAGDISDEDAEKLVAQLSEILSILLRLY